MATTIENILEEIEQINKLCETADVTLRVELITKRDRLVRKLNEKSELMGSNRLIKG